MPLEAYRGDTLCLKVRTIGEGAQYTVKDSPSEGPPRFVPYEALPLRAPKAAPPVNVGSLVRANGAAATPVASDPESEPAGASQPSARKVKHEAAA